MTRACWDRRAQRVAGCRCGESYSCARGVDARKLGRSPRWGDLATIETDSWVPPGICPHYLSTTEPGGVVPPRPGDSP
jgi:hypothetical protein